MSNLKVNTINDAAGGSSAVLYGVASPPNSMGFRNRIVNGDCRIDQRNAGASVGTGSGTGVYTVDRWALSFAQINKMTAQQNSGAVTPPAGFKNYLGVVSSSAYAVLTGDYFFLRQAIEGFNVSDLGWGAAGAQSVTLTFWVRSSLTGTFGGSFRNSGGNRSYPFTYAVSAANTWEQKTATIAGDTSGTWSTDNSTGIEVDFGLGVGSTFSGAAGAWSGSNFVSATGATSVVGTSGATFYITGVQLEAGTVASSFERRDYGRELQMCQRYYQKTYNLGAVPGVVTDVGATLFFSMPSGNAYHTRVLPVELRTTPTIVFYSPDGTVGTARDTGVSINRAMVPGGESNQKQVVFAAGSFSGSAAVIGHFTVSAEL